MIGDKIERCNKREREKGERDVEIDAISEINATKGRGARYEKS